MTRLLDREPLLLEESPQDFLAEVPIVPRHIEVEPRGSGESGLETLEIGDRDNEQPAGPKKRPALCEDSFRVRKMLQNVPDVYDVERVRGPGSSEHVAHEDRVSEQVPRVCRRRLGDLHSRDLPSVTLELGQRDSTPAADIQNPPLRDESLDFSHAPMSEDRHEPFEERVESPVAGPVVGGGIVPAHLLGGEDRERDGDPAGSTLDEREAVPNRKKPVQGAGSTKRTTHRVQVVRANQTSSQFITALLSIRPLW